MAKRIDLTGQRFGRLVVINYHHTAKNRHSYWLCKCDCENKTVVQGGQLVSGHTRSCGCLSREATKQRSTKHGDTKTRLFKIWVNMRFRCNNPHSAAYADYGGRGISVCPKWENDFVAFRDWALQNGYADNLSIDRIDVNGNYEPDNCRWADRKTQARNTRRNRAVKQFTTEGKFIAEYRTMVEAEEKTGVGNYNIVEVCRGRHKTAGGYVWQYAD